VLLQVNTPVTPALTSPQPAGSNDMAKNSPSRPTGKSGRGVMARPQCCSCSGSGKFRFGDGRIVRCTNCSGTGKQ
jgi:hypothetical protein